MSLNIILVMESPSVTDTDKFLQLAEDYDASSWPKIISLIKI